MSVAAGRHANGVSSSVPMPVRRWPIVLSIFALLFAAGQTWLSPAHAQGAQQIQSGAVRIPTVMMIDTGAHALVFLGGNAQVWAEVDKSNGDIVAYYRTTMRTPMTSVDLINPDTNLKLHADLVKGELYVSTDGLQPTTPAAKIVATAEQNKIPGVQIHPQLPAWALAANSGQRNNPQGNQQDTQQTAAGNNDVTGSNVMMVDTGAHAIVKIAGGAWAEVDKSNGSIVQYFVGVARSATDIVIVNPDTNMRLRADIPELELYISNDGSRPVTRAASIEAISAESRIPGSNVAWNTVTKQAVGQQPQAQQSQGQQQAQSGPNTLPQNSDVTGMNVRMIDTGAHALVEIAGGAWAEVDKSNSSVVQYLKGSARSQTDIVLFNPDTNMRLRANLPASELYVSTDGSRPSDRAASVAGFSAESRIPGSKVAWDTVTREASGQQAQSSEQQAHPAGGGTKAGGTATAGNEKSSKVTIRNHITNGGYLNAQDSGVMVGKQSGDYSEWLVSTISTSGGKTYSRLKSVKTGEYLTTANGAVALTNDLPNATSALWKLISSSDGSITIQLYNSTKVIIADNGQLVLGAEKSGSLADDWIFTGDQVTVTVKPTNTDPATAGGPSVKFSNQTDSTILVVRDPNGDDQAEGELTPKHFKVFHFLPKTEIGFYDSQAKKWVAGHTYIMPSGPEPSIEIFADKLEDTTPAAPASDAASAKNTISMTVDNKAGFKVSLAVVGVSTAGPDKCTNAASQTINTYAVGASAHQPVVPGNCLMFFKAGTTDWIGGSNAVPIVAGPNFPSVEVDATSVHAPETLYSQKDIDTFAQQVVQSYIQAQVSGPTATFCWRNSNGRGVGTIPGHVADCPAGYTNNGLTCGKGADTIPAPSQGYASCPALYKNSGFHTCFRSPDTYWQCGGDCRSPYTHASVCTCQYWGDTLPASSMVCPSGYKVSVIGTCIKQCPAGYTNTGETCFRGADTLGMTSMICKSNEVRGGGRCFPKSGSCGTTEDYDAGLCYKKCTSKQDGVGPVCWDKCPASLPHACGAGCAVDKDTCDQSITDQVTSPVMAAGNIALTVVTAGGATEAAAAAETAAKTGAEAGGEAAAKATAQATIKETLKTGVQTAMRKAAVALTTDAGRAQLVKEVAFQTAINAVITTGGYAGTKIYSTVALQKQVQDDVVKKLAANTDPKVIDAITTQVMAGVAAQNPGSDFPWASLDPTGIASIVEAYNYPLCSDVK